MTYSRTLVTPYHRRLATLLATLCGTVAFAAPAVAGVAETPNACKFTYDNEYRTQGVEPTASAPAEAGPGQPFTLTGEKLEVARSSPATPRRPG